MLAKKEYLKTICSDKLSVDPDHTKEAREFYAKFWGRTLSNSVSDYDGAIGNYRGETIISFNTVSGCMIRMLPIYKDNFYLPTSQEKRLDIIINSPDCSESIKEDFKKFYLMYHTLANFMPFVRGSVNINTVKGSGAYHDFPDLFFEDLSKRRPESVFNDEINASYFRKFGNCKEFIKANYLQDFFENNSEDLKCKQLAPHNVKMPYRKSILDNMSDNDKCICTKYIENFLTTAIEIIERRAERLSMEEI